MEMSKADWDQFVKESQAFADKWEPQLASVIAVMTPDLEKPGFSAAMFTCKTHEQGLLLLGMVADGLHRDIRQSKTTKYPPLVMEMLRGLNGSIRKFLGLGNYKKTVGDPAGLQ